MDSLVTVRKFEDLPPVVFEAMGGKAKAKETLLGLRTWGCPWSVSGILDGSRRAATCASEDRCDASWILGRLP